MQRTLPQRTSLSGFNLVEAAIVLGIIGLVIGGIWAAAATVHQQYKVSRYMASLSGFTQKLQAVFGQYTPCLGGEYTHYRFPQAWDQLRTSPEWQEMIGILPVYSTEISEPAGNCTGTQPVVFHIAITGRVIGGAANGICLPIRRRLDGIIASGGRDFAVSYPNADDCWWGWQIQIALPRIAP